MKLLRSRKIGLDKKKPEMCNRTKDNQINLIKITELYGIVFSMIHQ